MRRSHSEGEWRALLVDQVAPCFREGLTGWDAQGPPDGSVSRESAKVLVVVHDSGPTAQAALAEVVARCKHTFEQESVL